MEFNNYTKKTYNKNHYVDATNVLKNKCKTFTKMYEAGELTEEQYNYNMRLVEKHRYMYAINTTL